MVQLPYDTRAINFPDNDPQKTHTLITGLANYKPTMSEEELVEHALNNPIESVALAKMAREKKNIVIITSDHTRPVPSHITLPILLKEIRKTNQDGTITLLISTGTHRPTTTEEMEKKFGRAVMDQVVIVNHEAKQDQDMTFLGTLPSGGELWINKLAVEADLLISEGFIEPHFFAGFSGGRKSILPGIASLKTVMFNHNSQFIASPKARTGSLEGNPIHEDMVWAAEQAKLAFILNVVINSKKKIINCFAGHPFKAHYQGCEFAKSLTGVDPEPADIVISTNGGFPMDQNLYQAVKGMTAAEATAKPGGIIIMLASCRDGLGGDHFYHLLADEPTPDAAMEKFLKVPREETPPDQWESQILARILQKHRVIMVCDPSIEKQVKEMHLEYAPSLEDALSLAKKTKGDDATITIIPDGVGIIVKNV